MKFINLSIQNFRAIKRVELLNLNEMVIIAGPNGCGKSCIFDAIRLFKSIYGGYQPNEWQQWFGEFQINMDGPRWEFQTLFQDRSKPIYISADLELDKSEIEFIKQNAHTLIKESMWELMGQMGPETRYVRGTSLYAQLIQRNPNIEDTIKQRVTYLLKELESNVIHGEIQISSDLSINMGSSEILQLIFSIYSPQNIGIIDYHGAQRNYYREQVHHVNLNINTSEQQLSQSALYNYSNKYSNVKTQLASSYIKDLLAKESGRKNTEESLIVTLQELFETFFPGKKFLGPKPTLDGALTFPVQTESGDLHDINELSSGEKEVLYGYLRIRNTSPYHSVLLLDEPELHLNPRLICGLPQFYYKHLGKVFDNQIWLLTHSDTLLRESVGNDGVSIFHMLQAKAIDINGNQLQPIQVIAEVDSAVVDLVGDLAVYRPGAKVVIFEGGGDSEFDVFMVKSLFSQFSTAVNMISGGNKTKVRQLHTLLDQARNIGALSTKFYSIVDHDADDSNDTSVDKAFKWDVYHIENYLLEPKFIFRTLNDALAEKLTLKTESDIEAALVNSAKETQISLVRESLEKEVNHKMVSCIQTRINPSADNISEKLSEAIDTSLSRLKQIINDNLTIEKLTDIENMITNQLNDDLMSGRWKYTFRGRDILKRFIAKYGNGMKYETFRNLIIAKMRDNGFQPEGMREIIEAIIRN